MAVQPGLCWNRSETPKTSPDSLVVRASASGAVDPGFAPRSRHTKGVKNNTSSSLADARIKRIVLGDKVR